MSLGDICRVLDWAAWRGLQSEYPHILYEGDKVLVDFIKECSEYRGPGWDILRRWARETEQGMPKEQQSYQSSVSAVSVPDDPEKRLMIESTFIPQKKN